MSIKEFYGFMLQQLEITEENRLEELTPPLREKARRELSYYRQRKMDLIARMATDWPRWGCGLDFYTFFVQPLLRNPLLLHFINLSDDIDLSQIDIKYGYVESDGTIKWVQSKIEIQYGQDKKEIDKPNLVDHAISLLKEVKGKFQITPKTDNLQSSLVRVRDADIGVQSFFSFFEGLIRNAAKHRIREGEEEQLEVRIVFCEDERRLKSLFEGEEDVPNVSEDRRFCYMLISANTDKLKDDQGNPRTVKEGDAEKPLLEFLKNQIRSRIIDEVGGLIPGSWGLKEMKICAAFLSGAPLEEVNSENPSYIWVTSSPKVIWKDIDQDKRIAYVIRLEKPRYVLAVVPREKKPEDVSEWENQGVKVIEPAELEATDYDYDFLYLDNSVELPSNIERAIFPQREIKNSVDLSKKSEPMEFFYNVYDLHLNKLIGNESYKICIYFEDDQKAGSWQDWWSRNAFQYVKFVSPEKEKWNNCWNEIQKDQETRKILILRHKGIASLYHLKRSKKLNKVCYQEYCSYSDPFFSFLYNIDPNSLAPLVLRQVIESAILNVLVIDERVAQVLTKAEVTDESGKVRLEEKLYWMGIYVAKTVEVNGQSFNYIGNASSDRMVSIKINDILKGNTLLEEGFPIHILLIHATKLNKIASALSLSNVKLISKLKENIPYVVVHSGRGKTKGDIPSNAPFLEYSIVQRYLLQEPSKFYLTQIALSAKGGD